LQLSNWPLRHNRYQYWQPPRCPLFTDLQAGYIVIAGIAAAHDTEVSRRVNTAQEHIVTNFQRVDVVGNGRFDLVTNQRRIACKYVDSDGDINRYVNRTRKRCRVWISPGIRYNDSGGAVGCDALPFFPRIV
jgi:hypothetical protein